MPRQQLENLITRLHEEFNPGQGSPLQQQWLDELQKHLHDSNQPEPADPSLKDMADQLLENLEIEHPQAAGIVREIIVTLGRLGL